MVVQLGHDGVQSGQGWFVKSVEVDMPQRGVNVLFPCDRWLAKDKDDGLTERTLNVLDAARAHYKPSWKNFFLILLFQRLNLQFNFVCILKSVIFMFFASIQDSYAIYNNFRSFVQLAAIRAYLFKSNKCVFKEALSTVVWRSL